MKKNSLFADILNSVTKCFLVLVAAVIIMIAVSGIRIIDTGNVAIILRFGKLVGDTYDDSVHEAGLLFAFPYIIDEVITVPTGSVIEQTVTTHYTEGRMTTLRQNGYVITADSNIAVISASVKYVISDPIAYALNISDISKLIDASVSSAMVSQAAGIAVDDLLTSGKDAFASSVLSAAQNKLDRAEAGVTIGSIELTNVSMPADVKDTYDEVNSASVRAATLLEQAAQYRETRIPAAQAEAERLIQNANSEYSSAVAAANSELSEFWGVLDEYQRNPETVSVRIYNTKLSSLMNRIGTIRAVADGETRIFINTNGSN